MSYSINSLTLWKSWSLEQEIKTFSFLQRLIVLLSCGTFGKSSHFSSQPQYGIKFSILANNKEVWRGGGEGRVKSFNFSICYFFSGAFDVFHYSCMFFNEFLLKYIQNFWNWCFPPELSIIVVNLFRAWKNYFGPR